MLLPFHKKFLCSYRSEAEKNALLQLLRDAEIKYTNGQVPAWKPPYGACSRSIFMWINRTTKKRSRFCTRHARGLH